MGTGGRSSTDWRPSWTTRPERSDSTAAALTTQGWDSGALRQWRVSDKALFSTRTPAGASAARRAPASATAERHRSTVGSVVMMPSAPAHSAP